MREDYTLFIIVNDVISLFPSLDSVNTGRIVREEVARSTIEIDGFSTKLGLHYIAMNQRWSSRSELSKARANSLELYRLSSFLSFEPLAWLSSIISMV